MRSPYTEIYKVEFKQRAFYTSFVSWTAVKHQITYRKIFFFIASYTLINDRNLCTNKTLYSFRGLFSNAAASQVDTGYDNNNKLSMNL